MGDKIPKCWDFSKQTNKSSSITTSKISPSRYKEYMVKEHPKHE